MVRPDSKAQETDRDARPGDKSISKDRFAREDRQDLRNDPEGWQDQDIHLRVPKGPKQVLPEQRITTKCVLVEMSTDAAIQQQQYACSGQARQSKEQQERSNQ